MSYKLLLTDEQAAWLKLELARWIRNEAWTEPGAKASDDEREHAETIKRKLDDETARREW